MDDILNLVRESLSDTGGGMADSVLAPVSEGPKNEETDGDIIGDISYPEPDVEIEDWVDNSEMMEFVDTEGAFEGDLDAEEPDE